ncbi:MAG: nucleotidyltransferase family protein [Candidatus Zixiibacteriota bacterium]
MRTGIEIEKKLAKAVEYLKSIGCKEIILFGSLSEEEFDESSDIDLAVSGISPRTYFRAVATLPSLVRWKVDLVTLDYSSTQLKGRIQKRGRKLYVA